MLGKDDRVLCAGTVMAASIPERVDAAVEAGFTAISLLIPDVDRAENEGLSQSDIRAMITDAGLQLAEFDSIGTWLPGSEPSHELSDLERAFFRPTEEVLTMAEALGARSVTVYQMLGDPVAADAAAEAFADLCDRAAEHGLLAHIEAMPWTAIRTVSDAWDIVRLADRPNGGLLFDVWHHLRGGLGDDAAREIPGDRIFAVHLSDAPAERQRDDLVEETMHDRLLPGEGVVDVAGKIRMLDALGCTAPLGVEVFSDELSALPTREAARRAAHALAVAVEQARSVRTPSA